MDWVTLVTTCTNSPPNTISSWSRNQGGAEDQNLCILIPSLFGSENVTKKKTDSADFHGLVGVSYHFQAGWELWKLSLRFHRLLFPHYIFPKIKSLVQNSQARKWKRELNLHGASPVCLHIYSNDSFSFQNQPRYVLDTHFMKRGSPKRLNNFK
jgi:hypothetical protein